MRKDHRLLSLTVCLVLLLSANGCASAPQEIPSEPETIRGSIVLTDPVENSRELPFMPEAPQANNESVFSSTRESSIEQPGPSVPSSAPEQPTDSKPADPEPKNHADSSDEEERIVSPQSETAHPEQSEPQSQSSSAGMVSAPEIRQTSISGEVRSVWISYLELDGLLRGKTKSQFTANIRAVFDNCGAYGLNTVVVHVRPFADAIYKSDFFPWSYLCTGTEGVDPGFDPLSIMVEEAHARNLRFEAWINPYRIRPADNKNALSSENQASRWIDAGDGAVIRYNGVTSYNPASPKARELIVNGARELVRNYGVDGIHIDDYFYPTTDAAFDSASYAAYKNGGGTLDLAGWRRQNVETLIKELYAGIKAENSRVKFGISPQSSVYNNYHAMYLDVAKIASGKGYCDYICPQIYFGYQNDAQPYLETLRAWEDLVDSAVVDLYVGLAVYKVGAADSWAGTGKSEWVENTNLLMRMVESAREQSSYAGFVLYRYDSMFNPSSSVAAHVQKEYLNLRSLL